MLGTKFVDRRVDTMNMTFIRWISPAVLVLATVLAGCQSVSRIGGWDDDDLESQLKRGWLSSTLSQEMIVNAVVVDRTILPHHFLQDGAVLTDLGRRDVGILAVHYKAHPGPVAIRQGDATFELYQRRVHTVLAALGEAGVDVGHVTVADTLAGGGGLPSDRVIVILDRSGSGRLATASPKREQR